MTNKDRREFQWRRLMEILYEHGRVNVFCVFGMRCAIAWTTCSSSYMDGKKLRSPMMAQVFVFHPPFMKPKGFRISRKYPGAVITRGYIDTAFLGEPVNKGNTAIPDEYGVSINSSRKEILDALKRAKEQGSQSIN